MKPKIIFLIAVVAIALILLLTGAVTFQQIWDNNLQIGAGLVAIYAWVRSEENHTKIKQVKAENEDIKEQMLR